MIPAILAGVFGLSAGVGSAVTSGRHSKNWTWAEAVEATQSGDQPLQMLGERRRAILVRQYLDGIGADARSKPGVTGDDALIRLLDYHRVIAEDLRAIESGGVRPRRGREAVEDAKKELQ